LWAQGKIDAAIQLEHIWEELAKTHNVNTLCGYVLGSLDPEQDSNTTERIRAEHSVVRSQ